MKWRNIKIDWPGVGAHIFWLIVWIGFYIIWGEWKWRTTEFGTPEWMFDNVGHALGGLVGAINAIYEMWYFFPLLYYERDRALRWSIIYIVIPMTIGFSAVIFEVGEMYHDFQNYSVQAQKGGADTTIDIVLAIIFAYPGILTAYLYNRFFEKISPIRAEVNELRARAHKLRRDIKRLKDEETELTRKYRALRRNQLRSIPPHAWAEIKDTLGLTKEDEDM